MLDSSKIFSFFWGKPEGKFPLWDWLNILRHLKKESFIFTDLHELSDCKIKFQLDALYVAEIIPFLTVELKCLNNWKQRTAREIYQAENRTTIRNKYLAWFSYSWFILSEVCIVMYRNIHQDNLIQNAGYNSLSMYIKSPNVTKYKKWNVHGRYLRRR